MLVAGRLAIVRRMEIAIMAAAALAGVAFGWWLPAVQHVLYTEPEFRAAPAAGRRLLPLRLFATVSAAAGAALALRPGHYDLGPALLSAGFAAILIALSSTDFDRRRIPNRLSYPAVLAALAVCWAWPDRTASDILLGGAAGAAAGILMVGAGVVLGGGELGLGVGDGKLMVLIGLVVGWPAIIPALFYGILGAGVVALVLMLRRGRRAKFSYGPYLAAGGILLLLFPNLA